MKAKAHLRPCLKRCRHCRIFFLTHPRNRGREDLGCPFGCRDAHRRTLSTERSRAYSDTPAGKLKKKLQNAKRCRNGGGSDPGEQSIEEPAAAEIDRLALDRGVLEYVRLATSLIEGRAVSLKEVIEMLRRTVSQRRFARERRIDYVVRTLREKPP